MALGQAVFACPSPVFVFAILPNLKELSEALGCLESSVPVLLSTVGRARNWLVREQAGKQG
jgi:hypothetical protein